jgi:hypothetical protein
MSKGNNMERTTLKELKEIVDSLYEMSTRGSDAVMIHFKTFDSNFDENADEYQRPKKITSVEFDILNCDKITITIENETPENTYSSQPRVGDKTCLPLT